MNVRNLAALLVAAALTVSCADKPAATGPRLYILDCGDIKPMDPTLFGLKKEEIAGDASFVTPCYLVVHPKGNLIWDVGQVPDAQIPDDGTEVVVQDLLKARRKLVPQLEALGVKVSDIDYIAMSHYHLDHTANANLFAGSTWIVQKGDRDPILAPRPANPPATGRVPDPKFFEGLANSKTIVLNGEDHDVFGDGTVVIKSTPGHTPGHQSLFLKLANTGGVLLAGDLYHYPEEITYKKIPSFDTNKEQTARSRAMIEEFVKQNRAQLWIQHDYTTGLKRKIAPAFYD